MIINLFQKLNPLKLYEFYDVISHNLFLNELF